jgi:predicted transcriptional regulator
MARKRGEDFTEVELEIMRVLWERGACSSDEIRVSLPGAEKRKDSTVRTLLGIMEKKGYVSHAQAGRAFMYSPVVKQEAAQKRMVKKILEKVFDNSPQMMLQCLLDTTELDQDTVEEIESLLKKNR